MKKVALVSGASSGIGKETAKILHKSGFTVYGAARRTENMKDLDAIGVNTRYMDVTNEESMKRVVEAVIQREGRIDVLVNYAGFGIYGTVEDVPIEEARRQMEVNVFGLARLTQLVLPHMRKQLSGKIVNISSVAGVMSMPLGAWYHASKHAVEAISDSLRVEVEPFNIDVIIIEPGIINTEWWPITRKNLEKVSEKTAYGELVEKGKKYLDDPGKESDPRVIARLIKKAVTVKNPKTRYTDGQSAKLIVTAKKKLSDRKFDSVMKKKLELTY